MSVDLPYRVFCVGSTKTMHKVTICSHVVFIQFFSLLLHKCKIFKLKKSINEDYKLPPPVVFKLHKTRAVAGTGPGARK